VIAERSPQSTDSCIVLDLHPARLGRCYDAFWNTYGVVDSMPIVARSYTELLVRLAETSGTEAELTAHAYGDAYDPQL
jgi:hypothetical protein